MEDLADVSYGEDDLRYLSPENLSGAAGCAGEQLDYLEGSFRRLDVDRIDGDSVAVKLLIVGGGEVDDFGEEVSGVSDFEAVVVLFCQFFEDLQAEKAERGGMLVALDLLEMKMFSKVRTIKPGN